MSSRFNINNQNCEIEALPPLKGESSCVDIYTIKWNKKGTQSEHQALTGVSHNNSELE